MRRHQATLLAALGYPRAAGFSAGDAAAFRALVVWLENTKVRQYPVEERKQLGDTSSPGWQAAFQQYLDDLECPLQLSQHNQGAVLEWLLHHAVSLEYADHAEQYGDTLQQLVQQQRQQQPQQHGKAAAQQAPLADVHAPQVQQQLAALFQALHVDTRSGALADHLQAAKDVLRDSVLPSLTDASVQHSLGSGGAALDPSMAGFETGDARVDELAALLRLLYVKDLRQLQTAIDRMVVDMQEYTANPRTDASLGKVGR